MPNLSLRRRIINKYNKICEVRIKVALAQFVLDIEDPIEDLLDQYHISCYQALLRQRYLMQRSH